MEPGKFKVVVAIEGVNVDGTPIKKEFEVGVTQQQASEILVGVANLVEAVCITDR